MFQWFPGHMAKAVNKIKEMAVVTDLFIVVLDARIPLASYNDAFDSIAPHIPRLFLATKADLADDSKFLELARHFNHEHDRTLFVSLKNHRSRARIIALAQKLMAVRRAQKARKGILNPQLRVVVVGVPNVGKSTLINFLAKRTRAKVANTPGMTRASTWFQVGTIQLLDTPGVLWPKLTNDQIATKLVLTNIIKTSLVSSDQLFYEAYRLISESYPSKLKKIGLPPAFDKIKMHSQLIRLCESKRFVKKNNQYDTNKAITFFIDYLKNLRGVTYD